MRHAERQHSVGCVVRGSGTRTQPCTSLLALSVSLGKYFQRGVSEVRSKFLRQVLLEARHLAPPVMPPVEVYFLGNNVF